MTKSGLAGLAGSALSSIHAFLPTAFLEELCGDLLSTAGLQTAAWQHIVNILLDRGTPGVRHGGLPACRARLLSPCLLAALRFLPASLQLYAFACASLIDACSTNCRPAPRLTAGPLPFAQAIDLAVAEMERPDLTPSMYSGLLSASCHLTALPRVRAFWERCAAAPDEQTAVGVLQLADASMLQQDGGSCGVWWAGLVLRMLR